MNIANPDHQPLSHLEVNRICLQTSLDLMRRYARACRELREAGLEALAEHNLREAMRQRRRAIYFRQEVELELRAAA